MQVAGAISDVLVVLPSTASYRSPEFKNCTGSAILYSSFSDCSKSFLPPPATFRSFPFCIPRLARVLGNSRHKGLAVRAADSSSENLPPIAPLHLESPVGQLLSQILQTHPHLLPAAIDQQLENLQKEKTAENEESPSSAQDLLLYRRISEVKEKERKRALEEILYCLVVQKFVENGISMIPTITPTSDPTGRVDFWPNQEQKLEAIHSAEAFEMIQSHLSVVLGERLVGPLQTIVEMSKIKLGKLYAASVMYGYFLKRVDQRFQLERSMKTLPGDLTQKEVQPWDQPPVDVLSDPDSLFQDRSNQGLESYGELRSFGDGKPSKLRSYVMYLDSETLQRYATIRSKEAISLIEKQTQALFGRPDITLAEDGSIETHNDETLVITLSGLTMLVLEAVAFGSFLWDAEDYVEAKYVFVKS